MTAALLALVLAFTVPVTPPGGGAPASASQPGTPPTREPAPGAPIDPPPLPPGFKVPSEGWGAQDTTPGRVAQGERFLRQMHEVYAAAPGIDEESTLEFLIATMRQSDRVQMQFGTGNDMRVVFPEAMVIVAGDQLYVTMDRQAPGKYLHAKVEGSVLTTFAALWPNSSLASPTLTLRRVRPEEGYAARVFNLGSPLLVDVHIVGARTSPEGTQELLLKGTQAEMLVQADAATHLLKKMVVYFLPSGTQPTLPPVELTTRITLLPEPPVITFDPGDRAGFASIAALQTALEQERRVAAPAEPESEDPNVVVAQVTPRGSLPVGAEAPMPVLATMDGGALDLSTLRGKVVVLDLWATWANNCQLDLPLFQTFAAQMKDNPRVAVYAVNCYEQPLPPGVTEPPEGYRQEVDAKVREFWTNWKFTMPTLVDHEGVLQKAYKFQALPTQIVIDPQGRVVVIRSGYTPHLVEALTETVEKALQAPAAR